MARSFNNIWKDYEKFSRQLKDGKKEPAEILALCKTLSEREDTADAFDQMGSLLYANFEEFKDMVVKVSLASDYCDTFVRETYYDPKANVLNVAPLLVLKFINFCHDIADDPMKLNGLGDFSAFRHNSFLKELAKLPNKALLMLKILQQAAITEGRTHIGLTEVPQGKLDDTSDYQTLMWAFSELEGVMYKLNGVQLRTEYGIIWHESEWHSMN